MKSRRILALMHAGLVPPPGATAADAHHADWKTEYDVATTLGEMGHQLRALGVAGDLAPIREAIREFEPEIAFNLLENFDDVVTWDQNVVAYLELMKLPYTGCNARGLLLGRDKAITKKLLAYHRIRVPAFALFPRGRPVRRPRALRFPLIVKSLTLDASIGISQASLVESDERVRFVHESTSTHAIVESYIEGRELYVGVLGNERLRAFPVWELHFAQLPPGVPRIATERLKSSDAYRERHGITTEEARDLPEALVRRIQETCKRVYRVLHFSGYARMDLRLTPEGEVYVLEANPNPQLAYGEDFAESAERDGLGYEELLERIVRLGLAFDPARA